MFLTELTDLLRRGFTVTFRQQDDLWECELIDANGTFYRGRIGNSLPDALAEATGHSKYLSSGGIAAAE